MHVKRHIGLGPGVRRNSTKQDGNAAWPLPTAQGAQATGFAADQDEMEVSDGGIVVCRSIYDNAGVRWGADRSEARSAQELGRYRVR